ncbi:hypothetical protein HNR46_002304 [Haloferula luteola]|uniref:Uncharacterized protein n=1 Tax=Haloferula luteola TaxID=595692 RepID=A0A840V3I2_9BACT|nr:hypothetical protein [Haloferula luteola]MBB5352063.1 hypothetical protein [Haloferula luteola]
MSLEVLKLVKTVSQIAPDEAIHPVKVNAPRAAGPKDVEDAVEDAAPRVLPRTTPQSHRATRKKRAEDFPLRIGQAARILAHPEFLRYLTKLVQLEIRAVTILQTAS